MGLTGCAWFHEFLSLCTGAGGTCSHVLVAFCTFSAFAYCRNAVLVWLSQRYHFADTVIYLSLIPITPPFDDYNATFTIHCSSTLRRRSDFNNASQPYPMSFVTQPKPLCRPSVAPDGSHSTPFAVTRELRAKTCSVTTSAFQVMGCTSNTRAVCYPAPWHQQN